MNTKVFFRTADPDMAGKLSKALATSFAGRFEVGKDGILVLFRCNEPDFLVMNCAAKFYAEGWMGRSDQIRCELVPMHVDPVGVMLDTVEAPHLPERIAATMAVAGDEEEENDLGARFEPY